MSKKVLFITSNSGVEHDELKKTLDFLTSKGIRYTFVKKNDSGVRTYRYKKTTELFEALAEFYRYR